MEVLNRSQQHQTLIEAVQNHTPQVGVQVDAGNSMGWATSHILHGTARVQLT
jgi:stage III sporulation protein SpoIIIAA